MEKIRAWAEWLAGLFGWQLINNFEENLKRAWSIRFLAIAGILTGLEAGLPYIDQWIYVPRGLMALLTMVVICAAFIARTVAQKSITKDPENE